MKIKTKYVNMTDVRIETGLYRDGTLAVTAKGSVYDEQDQMSYPENLKLSVNLSEYGMVAPHGCFYCKKSSEMEGVAEALTAAGIAVPLREEKYGPFNSVAVLMELRV